MQQPIVSSTDPEFYVLDLGRQVYWDFFLKMDHCMLLRTGAWSLTTIAGLTSWIMFGLISPCKYWRNSTCRALSNSS